MIESIYLQGASGTLHAVRYGAELRPGGGVPLVLLHGVTGHAGLWEDVARSLSARRPVIALDFRGHGDSDWCPGHRYETEDHVDDVQCLVEQMRMEQFDLAGLSWGALVGIRYGALPGSRLRRLAIVDVEPDFAQGEREVHPRPNQFASRNEVLDWERKANPAAPEDLLRRFAYRSVCHDGQGGWRRQHDPYFLECWPFRKDDRWEELERLACPVLLVNGERSFVRRDVMQTMASRLREPVDLVGIPDCGHLVPLEAPRQLEQHLEAFFGRV